MDKLNSPGELRKLKDEAGLPGQVRDPSGTKIVVGMGTCGINAGARETMYAILQEIQRQDIAVHVSTRGCVGLCSQEPLVTIEKAGDSEVTYGKVTKDRVPKLIRAHLVEGIVVSEWVASKDEKR